MSRIAAQPVPCRRRAPALAAAAVAPVLLSVVPATAGAAPVIAADSVCVRPAQTPAGRLVPPPLTVGGSGFGPGARVELRRGARSAILTAAPDGTIAATLSVLDLLAGSAPRATPFTLSANDLGGPGRVPPPRGPSNEVRLRAAPLAFTVSPRRARPSARVTFRFSGFVPARMIWAHYRYRGVVRATVAMGRASAPCGVLSTRRVQIPLPDPRVGVWSVQFDHRRAFSPRARPRIEASLGIARTVR